MSDCESRLNATDSHIGIAPHFPVKGLESLVFLHRTALALRPNCSFVPIRKAGELLGPCFSCKYDYETVNTVEIRRDALIVGNIIILLDAILVTGRILEACVNLVNLSGARVLSSSVFLGAKDFSARERLRKLDVAVHSFLQI
ncbi:putative adenine phosphoribosyltransferase [Schistosoma mansoni]|uniref:adenine phosphoribosyltransferase n=1 Tax=Schistosoma mansoni TaxID=6183 RepID=G4VQJ2_SCHMA|nr:putative adenine phosphoribosyltransferase [Schistosoma mansoni]|eukprot:XP_018655137.1 putative adenine phosphoribosyltransferase [Schistosoma mansoni]